MDLLWRMSGAFGNDDLAILPIEIGALDRTVVHIWYTHISPVNMTGLRVHHNAIRKSAIVDDRLSVGAVGIHRVNATAAQFENE